MKGRYCYVPPSVFNELNNIKDEEGLDSKHWRSPAFKKMANYSQIGRETTKLKRFILGGK